MRGMRGMVGVSSVLFGVASAFVLGGCVDEVPEPTVSSEAPALVEAAYEDELEAEFQQCLQADRNHGQCVSCCERRCNELEPHDAQGCNRTCQAEHCGGNGGGNGFCCTAGDSCAACMSVLDGVDRQKCENNINYFWCSGNVGAGGGGGKSCLDRGGTCVGPDPKQLCALDEDGNCLGDCTCSLDGGGGGGGLCNSTCSPFDANDCKGQTSVCACIETISCGVVCTCQ